jgi:hypothetical protein
LVKAAARPSPPLGADLTENADISRAVRPEPQDGQGTDGWAPFAFTSSSKRWSHSLQANS